MKDQKPVPEIDHSIILEPSGKVRSAAHEPPQGARYTVRGEHGRGGQARVLVVADQRIGREIAWKELTDPVAPGSPGAATTVSSAAATRLMREARITGQLEHPNIVPVYDLGEGADGRPYYTMRLMRGETLAKRLRACRGLEERLKLLGSFWDICNAVAYAHRHGVIHRDLKPDNIMVGEFGETVLLDWGLAKQQGQEDVRGQDLETRAQELQQTREPGSTQAGSVLGTPSYMSPEQAEGELARIDERSDVWGLAAILYEILTGQPPFVGETPYEIIGKVLREPVRPVLDLCPEAPPELSAIAHKALQKEPDARYRTAAEMAEEVSVYMTGGRVRSYAYSPWELLRRFARRHRAVLVAASVALLVLVAMMIESYRRIANERDRAEIQRADAMSFANLLVSGLFEKVEPLAGSTPVLEEMVQSTFRYFEENIDPGIGAPEERLLLAQAYRRIASLAHKLGKREDAWLSAGKALTILEALVRVQPDNLDVRETLSWMLHQQGLLVSDELKADEARRLYERGLAYAERVADAAPSEYSRQRPKLALLCALGQLDLDHGRPEEARTCFQRLLKERERLLALVPDDIPRQIEVVAAYGLLASVEMAAGHLADARKLYRKALEIAEQISAAAPDDTDVTRQVLVASNKLASVVWQEGNRTEGYKLYQQAADIAEHLHAADPDNLKKTFDLASSLHHLSGAYEEDGQIEKATDIYSRVLPLAEIQVSRDPKNTEMLGSLAASYLKLGDLSLAAGRPREAEVQWQKCRETAERLVKLDPGEWINKQLELMAGMRRGDLAWLEGQGTESKENWRNFYREAEEAVGLDPKNNNLQVMLAEALLRTGAAERAIGIQRDRQRDSPDSLTEEFDLLQALVCAGQYREARALEADVLRLAKESRPLAVAARALLSWAALLDKDGKHASALALEAADLVKGSSGGLSFETWSVVPAQLALQALKQPGAELLRGLFSSLGRWNLGAPGTDMERAFRDFSREAPAVR